MKVKPWWANKKSLLLLTLPALASCSGAADPPPAVPTAHVIRLPPSFYGPTEFVHRWNMQTSNAAIAISRGRTISKEGVAIGHIVPLASLDNESVDLFLGDLSVTHAPIRFGTTGRTYSYVTDSKSAKSLTVGICKNLLKAASNLPAWKIEAMVKLAASDYGEGRLGFGRAQYEGIELSFLHTPRPSCIVRKLDEIPESPSHQRV